MAPPESEHGQASGVEPNVTRRAGTDAAHGLPPPPAPDAFVFDDHAPKSWWQSWWPIVLAALVVAGGLGALALLLADEWIGDGTRANEADQADHQSDFTRYENDFVTRFVVSVDGYRYVDEHEDQYENVNASWEAIEAEMGVDAFGAISLHAVVADDPSQNTARAWNGDWEVGYLDLIQFNQPLPVGTDEEWSEFAAGMSMGGDVSFVAIDQLQLSGITVFVFENSERPNSRFHYVWMDQGVGGIIDGADRAPLETWLAAYLAVPKLAEGETVESADRLVTIPGFRYSNVDLDTIAETERPPPLDIPHSLHFVTDRNGMVGMLAIAPNAYAAALEGWADGLADFRETSGTDVHGYHVEILDGASGDRDVRAYIWKDANYTGLLATNPGVDDQAVAFVDAFLARGTRTGSPEAVEPPEDTTGDASAETELDPDLPELLTKAYGNRRWTTASAQPTGAVAEATAAIESSTDDPNGLAAAYADRSDAYRASRWWDEAAADATTVIELAPDDIDTLARAHLNLSYAHAVEGRWGEAIAASTMVIEMGSDDPDILAAAYENRGFSQLSLHEWDHAAVDATKAIDLQPGDPNVLAGAYVTRAAALGISGRWGAAQADANAAIRLSPDDTVTLANAYRNRAGVNLEWGRWGAAIADATAAIDLEPDDTSTLAWLYRIRGVAYMHRGRDDLAAPDFAFAAEVSPDSSLGIWVEDQLREIESIR